MRVIAQSALFVSIFQAVSAINPLRYEIDALRGMLIGTPSNLGLDLGVLTVACAAGVAASARLLRRLSA